MPKMIVLDLDGTLMDDNKNISSYTISILEKCKENGIKITLATARSENAAKRIINMVNPDFLILNDGALILNKSYEILHRKLLSIKTTDGILTECKNKLNINDINVETEIDFYSSFKGFYHSDWDYGIYYDFTKPLSQKSYKISVEIFDEETALDISKKFNECKLIYSFGENWYRIIHKEASKMAAIKIISNLQKIQISEIVSFGDDFNDIEMIKECGIGVAMENGIKEVKNIAKYICKSNNEDGVGKWIEENIL